MPKGAQSLSHLLCRLTSVLNALSSAARAPTAHSQSARRVRLQSNQKQLSRELVAMVRARGELLRCSSIPRVQKDLSVVFYSLVCAVKTTQTLVN